MVFSFIWWIRRNQRGSIQLSQPHTRVRVIGELKQRRSKNGLFLHLVDPQESTRINTTQPTPHQSQSHWRVEAAWRIKGSTTQKQQRRAAGSQEAHCSWSRRLKTQQRRRVAVFTKASTRTSKG
ncbi:unnamed protein product [Musa hybrid cultivar]